MATAMTANAQRRVLAKPARSNYWCQVLLVMLGLPSHAMAQGGTPSENIGWTTVTTWKDGCSGALSLTHDDNRTDFVTVVGPALDARGLKGTFNVIVQRLSETPDFRGRIIQMAARGHELASHTMYHRRCWIVPAADDPNDQFYHSAAEFDQDCIDSKRTLDALQARPTVTFTYPGGSYKPDTEAIVAAHFLSARTTGLDVNPSTPPDMFELVPCRVGNTGIEPAGKWLHYDTAYNTLRGYLDRAINEGVWVIEMYHSLTSGLGELDLGAYYDHLDDLVREGTAHHVWVAPQGDVVRYIMSRNAAVITIGSAAEGTLELTVDDGLPDALFDVPVTLRTTLPFGARAAVTHDGQPVDTRIDPGPETELEYCVYSVPADGRPVVIRWKPAATPANSLLAYSDEDSGVDQPAPVALCGAGLPGVLPVLVSVLAMARSPRVMRRISRRARRPGQSAEKP